MSNYDEYLTLGPTPAEEDCAQVGSDDYRARSRRESSAYINQLRRQFGPEPIGALLAAKSFPHDFGSYTEVVVKFDTNNPEAVEYAYRLEANTPGEWDEEAHKELQ